MKRKGYDEKRNAIVQAANRLFLEKGYESTSIDELLEAVKISKGTFYHYFGSKLDLLESIVENFTQSFVARLRPIINNEKMNALAKLNAYYELNQIMKKDKQEFFIQVIAVWYKEDNLVYKQRLNESLIEVLTPEVEKILRQGVAEGVFEITNPSETASLLNHLGFCLRDSMYKELLKKEADTKKIQAIVKTYQISIEKILAIPEGSLTIFSADAFN